MPVHDWTRVTAGNFHDFHLRWIAHLSEALNGGVLPNDYYALAEQKAEGPEPDVLTLRRADESWQPSDGRGPSDGMLAVAEHPPQVEVVEEIDDADLYARKADRIAVRHVSGDRAVAFIEIASPGNKNAAEKVRTFVEKLGELFGRGCHLLLIDVIPPGTFDPNGMHAAFWSHLGGSGRGVTPDRPFGVSSYRAARPPQAYVQPVALGRPLPDMPLFLTPQHYVNVPLEQTYLATWRGVPRRWKDVLEADPAA